MDINEIKSKDREIYSAEPGRDFFYASESANIISDLERQWMDKVVATRLLRTNLIALDVGCGTGVDVSWIKERSSLVVALDQSLNSLRAAAKRFKDDREILLVQGDAESLPLDYDSMDIIYCGSILHHLPRYENAIREFHYILKRDGAVLASEPCAYNPFAVIRRRFFPSIYHTADERPFPPKELISCFTRYFDCVYYRKCYFFAINASLVEKLLGKSVARLYLKVSLLVDSILMAIPVIGQFCWRIDIVAFKASSDSIHDHGVRISSGHTFC